MAMSLPMKQVVLAFLAGMMGCQAWQAAAPCFGSLRQQAYTAPGRAALPGALTSKTSLLSCFTPAGSSFVPALASPGARSVGGEGHVRYPQKTASIARPSGGSGGLALQSSADGSGAGGGGRARYQGPGFRVVKCFPRLARRQADQAVQVVCACARLRIPTAIVIFCPQCQHTVQDCLRAFV